LRRVITSRDVAMTYKATLGVPVAEPIADDYATRVVKYIPVEIVAAFVTIDGILQAATAVAESVHWLVFCALLLLTPLYTWRLTTKEGLPPAYAQIGISIASFAVWVFALGGPFKFLSWYNHAYGSVLLIIFTLIPPFLGGK